MIPDGTTHGSLISFQFNASRHSHKKIKKKKLKKTAKPIGELIFPFQFCFPFTVQIIERKKKNSHANITFAYSLFMYLYKEKRHRVDRRGEKKACLSLRNDHQCPPPHYLMITRVVFVLTILPTITGVTKGERGLRARPHGAFLLHHQKCPFRLHGFLSLASSSRLLSLSLS